VKFPISIEYVLADQSFVPQSIQIEFSFYSGPGSCSGSGFGFGSDSDSGFDFSFGFDSERWKNSNYSATIKKGWDISVENPRASLGSTYSSYKSLSHLPSLGSKAYQE
jgi:hypothetical protein